MKKTLVLVQCKDCKYCMRHSFPYKDSYSCKENEMRGSGDVFPNDFCSIAEKRADGEEIPTVVWKWDEELGGYEPEERT